MQRGLLARLGAGDPDTERDPERSIIEHLQVLLNTRRGSSRAAPDYGLADLVDMIHMFPEAIQTLKMMIRDTISENEPRLRNVNVRHVVDDDDPLMFRFEISARLAEHPRGPRLRLRTRVSARGVDVE